MSWTKRALIDEAYGELAMQGYVFDISPEEQQRAARRLEMMLGTWGADGIRVGYAFSADAGAVDLDEDSGVSLGAVETVTLNLAVRVAVGLGKQLNADTRRSASDGYQVLLRAAAMPQEQQLPGSMPIGAGNKPWRSNTPFTPPPDDGPLTIADDGGLTFGS